MVIALQLRCLGWNLLSLQHLWCFERDVVCGLQHLILGFQSVQLLGEGRRRGHVRGLSSLSDLETLKDGYRPQIALCLFSGFKM